MEGRTILAEDLLRGTLRAPQIRITRILEAGDTLRVEGSVTAVKAVRPAGRHTPLAVQVHGVPPPELPRTVLRRNPIWLGPPRLEVVTTTWTLPAGWSVEGIPDSVELDGAIGSIRSWCTHDGTIIRSFSRVESAGQLIPAEHYTEAVRFSAGVTGVLNTHLLLKRP
jgi:hypothetical protein